MLEGGFILEDGVHSSCRMLTMTAHSFEDQSGLGCFHLKKPKNQIFDTLVNRLKCWEETTRLFDPVVTAKLVKVTFWVTDVYYHNLSFMYSDN